MPQTYFIVPTAAGEAKMANAQALGLPFVLTDMGVGDGNGALPVPDRNRTTLINERRRAALNTLAPDGANPGQYVAEQVIPENVGGWWIRELGLYDADGTLCFYGNCPESYKPQLAEGSGRTQVVRMVVMVTGGVTVELKVDPAVVLATRSYCDTAIEAAMQKLDHKQSVLVATTANLPALSGLLTVDGVVLAAGNRVLVKDQVAAKDNGIYVVAAGAWARAADADAALEVTPGMLVPVEQGAANGDSLWQLVTDAPIIVGTTALTFQLAAGKTGVIAGTFHSVTVNSRGLVTGGTNPTTLAGHGITDGLLRLTTGQPLPVADIGPLWHDDYNSIMTWQVFNANGATYTGYASVLVGSLLADTQPTPRLGYVKSGSNNLSRATYAALRGWAMHNGIMVAEGVWAAGTIAVKDNVDGTTFTAYDVRGEFSRFWSDGRGVNLGRGFGTWEADDNKQHTHGGIPSSTASAAPNATGPNGITGYDGFTGVNGGTEARPRSVALAASIKY